MADVKDMQAWAGNSGAPKGASPPKDDAKPPAAAAEPAIDEALMEEYGAFIEPLESVCEEIDACIAECDEATLLDIATPDDDIEQRIADCLDGFDDAVQEAFIEHLPGIDMDNATALAQHLADEGFITDTEPFAAWLVRAGEVLGAEMDAVEAEDTTGSAAVDDTEPTE
jgi:hypothetical protein